jgi:hypothetical protein
MRFLVPTLCVGMRAIHTTVRLTNMIRRYLSLLAIVLVPGLAAAQEKLPDGAKVAKLEARPAAVKLDGPFAYSQVLVTATLDSGESVDVTRLAKIEVPKNLASISANGLVRPITDGAGDITVTLGDNSLKIPLTVSHAKSDDTVSFVKDVQPVLSKMGCTAGTCHGAQAGKNGFKLSLRGYDPIFDYRALTDDLEGRRFNRAAPEKSLMLLKTSGAVPHQGGVLTQPGEPYYELLRKWIAQGVKQDLDAPRVKSLAIFPKDPIIGRIGSKQQFATIATYTDGTQRDVTAETFIDSSNTDIATIEKNGLLTTVRRGEATMLARYEGAYAASTAMVMGDRTGFAWQERPVNNWIDELVDAKLKKVKVQASELCDDAEFVRRIHIDLTGLPPAADDVRAFLEDQRSSKIKRDELIDKLIGSEAFIEQMTNKWADLLQVNRKFLGDVGAKSFRQWIRNAVADNMPYDKFAYSILTASGSNVDNPPASYFKVLRAADAVMENTTQLFLAVRFNCNKCHDHPFERWTQDNYYNLAAFFAQTNLSPDPKFKGQVLGGTAVEGAKPLVEIITDGKSGDIRHARTNEIAPPKFPYVVNADLPPSELRRVTAAKWITSPANPYFAKSYVNRLWAYMLGTGIIEPIDDIRAGNPATNPELLDRLTKEFIASGFDARATIKTICKSRTYQLSIRTNKWNKDDEINYSHAQARRLSAESLYDAIHKVTGSQSKLPGLPAGSRAALLPDSNVELPGGFLELFGKPARESACECERSGGMNLGPILAMVNGPVLGDAIKDPANRINKIVASQKDDAKAVEELYLAVVNRYPTAKEKEEGVKALRSANVDHAAMLAEYKPKREAFEAYQKTLDSKQAAWEKAMHDQKPTAWTVLDVQKAESKHGAAKKTGAKLTINKDGSILASGSKDAIDVYTVVARAKSKEPITAVRLEVLADPSLPAKGPGRADNGNFVLNEFRLSYLPAGKTEAKPKPVKLVGAQSTFAQDQFPAANAVDGNIATGWAVAPQFGKDNAALFRFQAPIAAVASGVEFTAVLDQRFGTNHVVGKFRLSVATDKNPKLGAPVAADVIALLETPIDKRTAAQQDRLRALYLAQDKEYARLAADAANPPPDDARVLGAQDLVWALINNPAFLFNH